jgi:hypothetical protein
MLARMKNHTTVWMLLAFLGVISGLSGCDDTARKVKAADGASNRAILACDGKTAAQYVSKASILRLSQMIHLARTASKAQTKALPFADKFDVLTIRLIIPPERLRKLNGYEYYVEAVDSDMIWSTVGLKRERYTFDAARTQATIRYRVPIINETFESHWVFEDGGWKQDMVADVPDINRWGKEYAIEEQMTEDEFILAWLQNDWDTEVTDDIWNPVR